MHSTLRQILLVLCVLLPAGCSKPPLVDQDSLDHYRPDYRRGMQVYHEHCSSCHESGQQGAPMLSDVEEWENRGVEWPSLLQYHVEDGYLGMPAMGHTNGLGRRNIADAIYFMRIKIESQE